MFATILSLAASILPAILKMVGLGSSGNSATAGDQKAADEIAAVKAAHQLQQVQAQPDTTKGDLGEGHF